MVIVAKLNISFGFKPDNFLDFFSFLLKFQQCCGLQIGALGEHP